MNFPESNPATNPPEASPSLRAMILRLLASVKFAVTLIILIALLCVVGTLLPQGVEVAAYLQKNPAAAARMESFERMGLTHLFSSGGFLALLGLLAASVTACGLRRFAVVRRTIGSARRRALGSMLAHISLLLILSGAVIRGVWGQKGYLELREGVTATAFQVENGMKPLPFGLHLAKFEVEGYDQPKVDAAAHTGHAHDAKLESILVIQWPARTLSVRIPVKVGHEQKLVPPGEAATELNLFRVKVVKFVPDFYINETTQEAGSRSEEPRNPAILVQETGPNYQREQWLFANSPSDPHTVKPSESPLRLIYQAKIPTVMRLAPIKSFKSTLQVRENDQVVQTQTVEVNRPFAYKGYTFYQTGYNPQDLTWTSLQVVRDPGVPVVYAGFALMIVGLFVVFYLNPWMSSGRSQATAVVVAKVDPTLSEPSRTAALATQTVMSPDQV
jgi:hypothetical protein